MGGCALYLLIGALALSACATSHSWSYTPEPRQGGEAMINKSVAVLPFEDHRAKDNTNLVGLYLIPLMPYGWMDFETPEGPDKHATTGLWQFRPADDFSRAVAQEVENSRIFRETFSSNRASEGDLVLTGEIARTSYNGKLITYGMSIEGPLLWLIGLPATHVTNTLELRLHLSRSPSDPPIWSYTINVTDSATSWIYVMKPDFMYDELLKEGMKEALPSLREAATKLP